MNSETNPVIEADIKHWICIYTVVVKALIQNFNESFACTSNNTNISLTVWISHSATLFLSWLFDGDDSYWMPTLIIIALYS